MATDDFKRILEGLRVAVAVVDARGMVAFTNAACAQLTGHRALDLIAKDFKSLFHADDVKRVEHGLERIAERKTASLELEARIEAGEDARWVQLMLQPTLDSRDRPDGAVAVLQDIEAQRETESALNLTGARLLALAEASPNAAMVENPRGEVELANEAFRLLLGLESAPQSLLGLNALEVIARSKNIDTKSFEKARKKPDTPASVALKRDKGGAATLERQAIVIEGKPAGMLWTSKAPSAISQEDDRTAAEIVLIEKIGEELSVALEGLSAIAIRAQQMEFDPALVENFQMIRLSTETAMAAIGDLVDFSKVQGGGGVVLRRGDFGLREAVADLVKRVAPNAEEHGCRLRVKVEQDVADNLEGDVERLQLALKNLMDNAFQIFPGGEVSLQITPEYVTDSGIQLSFSVTVGDPGEKGSPRASADAGMGVAVARFMVGAMGGKLAVASRIGAEALYGFTIEFPVRPTPTPPSRASYASLVAMPVLVVSEDPEQRLTLTNWLRGWRMVPIEADNAPMALALLERLHEEGSPVPLVILSNRLPVQDGFLLAFRIRHHRQLRATLMLMLSTDAKPGDAIACRENGIAAYLRYPVPDKQLNAAIVAVTGASLDADETPTLVTRHSLREQRKGATILLVDSSRDSHMLAAHILRKRDCSLVAAGDFDEAVAALDQDMYDLVLVDTSLKGVDGPDAAEKLRAHITRNPEGTKIYATSLEHSVVFRVEKKEQGFDGSIGKPLRKDDLLGVLKAIGKLSEPGED